MMAMLMMNHTSRRLVHRHSSTRRHLYSWASAPSSNDHYFSSSPTNNANGNRKHLIFGANTDVGKTVISAGLCLASLRQEQPTIYIKPLQCGGSDEIFVKEYCRLLGQHKLLTGKTLFDWETPASPHVASRAEQLPVSDEQVLSALEKALQDIDFNMEENKSTSTTWVETAGGVLSPSSASPENKSEYHAMDNQQPKWGWLTQGSLYQPLAKVAPVVLVGDGRLGGISATLSSLESLLIRGYNVAGIVMLETGYDNVSAIREYADRPQRLQSSDGTFLFDNPEQSIISLPQLPPEPEPLHEWYQSEQVVQTLDAFNAHLKDSWEKKDGNK